MFIIPHSNPPYNTIFIWSTLISNPSLLIITSRVEDELPCYRPAACLLAHPAGAPGNCNLPARLSLRPPMRPPGIRKLLLSECLRISNSLTQGLIHNICVCLGGLKNQQINKYSALPFVGVRLVSCHSASCRPYSYFCYYLISNIV